RGGPFEPRRTSKVIVINVRTSQGTTVCSPHPPEECVECGGRGEKGDSLVKGPAGTSTSVVPPHQEPCAGAWQHGPSVPGPGLSIILYEEASQLFRWSAEVHRELIPGLSCVSPSTAPSRESPGHPGRSGGPCGYPRIPGEVHNPAMLHLPSVQVAPLAPHWRSAA
ncbi:hypothetical protein JOQ06_000348, partial [Pogonophryne albipinna]